MKLKLPRQWSVTLKTLMAAIIPLVLMSLGYGAMLYQQQLDSALARQQQANQLQKRHIETDLERLRSRLLASQTRFSLPLGQTSQNLAQQWEPLLRQLVSSEAAFSQAIILSPTEGVLGEFAQKKAGLEAFALASAEIRAIFGLADSNGSLALNSDRQSGISTGLRQGQRPPSSVPYIIAPTEPGEDLNFALALAIDSPATRMLVVAVNVGSLWLNDSYLPESADGLGGRHYLLDAESRLRATGGDSGYRVGDVVRHLTAAQSLSIEGQWPLNNNHLDGAGDTVYTCLTAIPALAWTLVSEVPRARILQQVWPLLSMLFIFSFVAGILIIGFVLWQMKVFLLPFSKAREAIDQVSEGRYGLSLKPVGIAEIDAMTTSIQHMSVARQTAEQALRESRQDLLVTLNSIGDGVIACDEKGLITRMNRVAEELTAWSIEDALGKPIKTVFNIIDASTGEAIDNPVEKVLSTGKTVYLSNHTTLIANDGRQYQIADSAAPILDDDGNTLGMVLAFNNVTEAYLLREEANAAQRQLQGLFEDMHTMVCITEPDGTAIFANKAPLAASGVELDDVLGKKLWDCVWFEADASLQAQMKKNCRESNAGASIQQDIQISVLGGLLWVDYSMHPMFNERGEVVQILHEGRDISTRKTMEDDARSTAQHLKLYREQTPLAAIEWSTDIQVVDWNGAAEKMFGYSLDDIKGRSIVGLLLSEEEWRDAKNIFDGLRIHGGASTSRTHTYTKAGRSILCEWHNTLLRDKQGVVIGAASVVLDISARELAKAALLLKEQEQRDVLNCMVDAVITIDEHGQVLTVNDAVETMFGYRGEELIGNNVTQLMTTADALQHDAHLQHYLRTGEAHVIGLGREVDGQHKNNKVLPLRLQITELPKDLNGVRRFIATCHDLTKYKQQEEQLRRSHKLDALGKLTGGVAHDFNNILGVVTGYADLLEERLKEQPSLARYAHEINHAGQRGAKLTQKLLSFTRQGRSESARVDINKLIMARQDMLQKTLTVGIKLVLELADKVWPIWLDSSDLEDAILNISINAMHAMDGQEAQLTLRTSNQSLNLVDAKTLGLTAAGDYVSLAIADTGAGMGAEIRDKIFDPFFSTKGEQGTGLGLSQVFGFVTRSQGVIKVYSEPGHGSEFVLYFPRYLEDGGSLAAREPEDAGIDDGEESILVVDDEIALQKLAAELLSQRGYQVLCAASAEEALQILQSEKVDLLLSDVIMPNMDGYQLAVAVKEKYPAIKIVLASGFTDERNVGDIGRDLQEHMLHKPYNSQVLVKTIRSALDQV